MLARRQEGYSAAASLSADPGLIFYFHHLSFCIRNVRPSLSHQLRALVAADCIIFGFDGKELKLLLIHRGFEPSAVKWSPRVDLFSRKKALKTLQPAF